MELKLHCPPAALAIIRTLQTHGHQAVFAGGCVRDAMRGETPHDWDIATSARPQQVEALFPRTIPVGKSFGIIVVIGDDNVNYEVATFRGDSAYSDGRHPDAVRFVDMEEDVRRRDFTVNAMLYDPLASRLYDFAGGQQDLRSGILRAVGDPRRRFAEDKLRVVRAVRFAAQLNFAIEPLTLSAMAETAPLVKRAVSAERIAAETEKILLSGASRHGFSLMEECRLLPWLYPELSATAGVEQPPQYHPEGDVWQHTLKALGIFDETVRRCRNGAPGSPRFDSEGRLQSASDTELRILAWAVLLHDIGKPATFVRSADRIRFNNHDVVGADMTRQTLTALHLPGAVIGGASFLVREHMNQISLPAARVATRRRKLQSPLFPLQIEIFRIDSLASSGLTSLHARLLQWWQEEQARPAPFKPTLCGRDLIDLGIPPGPRIGELLRTAADYELEHPFASRSAAISWMRQFLADCS